MIQSGSRVTLHFSLRLETGEVIEDTRSMTQTPTFTLGDGKLLAGFENKLLGLKKGMQRSFLIPAEEAFGLHKADNIKTQSKSVLGSVADDKDLKPGLVVGFTDAQGQEVSAVVTDISERQVQLDFNHPLAGKDILFEVEIIDVQIPSTTH